MNKAPVLSEDEIARTLRNTPRTKLHTESVLTAVDMAAIKDDMKLQLRGTAQAQNDADHKHYQGIIREIFEEIERLYPYTVLDMHPSWQSLKTKYQEEK